MLLAGYAWARMRRLPQIDDEAARAELRSEQRARLTGLFRGRSTPALEQPDGGPAYWATGANEP